MWKLSVPWWELLIRATAIYVFVLVLLRTTGKRQIGQLAPFDLVLLLILANTVQNAMNAGDNSLTAGLILGTTIILLNYVVGWIAYRSKTIERVIEGRPRVVIHNGVLFDEVMRREKLSHHELMAALRSAGCDAIEDVHVAMFENTGGITVTPKKKAMGA
jgi:uncharacterized membrane protein YcaP (DUF421 family)